MAEVIQLYEDNMHDDAEFEFEGSTEYADELLHQIQWYAGEIETLTGNAQAWRVTKASKATTIEALTTQRDEAHNAYQKVVAERRIAKVAIAGFAILTASGFVNFYLGG